MLASRGAVDYFMSSTSGLESFSYLGVVQWSSRQYTALAISVSNFHLGILFRVAVKNKFSFGASLLSCVRCTSSRPRKTRLTESLALTSWETSDSEVDLKRSRTILRP